jgi:glycosyltransferase involved in cell wall biosynthesis
MNRSFTGSSERTRRAADPVRLALFISDLGAGGAQRTVINLLNTLPADRAAAVLVSGSGTGGARPWIDPARRFVDLKAARTRDSLWALRRFLQAERPDVLLSTMVDANIVAAAAVRFIAGPPHLIVRETNSHRARSDIGPLRRSAVRWAYRRAEAVVALSHGVGRELIADYGLDPARVTTIHNPVDVEGWRRRAAAARESSAPPWGDFGGGGPVLVATGRLTRQKGFDLLLRALAGCTGAVLNARLVIVGEGPERESLAALAGSLGLSDRVHLAGFVADPAAWYAHGDLFVLPSRWEGFGHVIVEAMACGLPVVAFDCPYGPADILGGGEGGLLVPSGDVEALAAAIDRLLGDTGLRRRLAGGLQGAAERFSLARIAAQYLQLIETVVADGKAQISARPDAA